MLHAVLLAKQITHLLHYYSTTENHGVNAIHTGYTYYLKILHLPPTAYQCKNVLLTGRSKQFGPNEFQNNYTWRRSPDTNGTIYTDDKPKNLSLVLGKRATSTTRISYHFKIPPYLLAAVCGNSRISSSSGSSSTSSRCGAYRSG